MKIDKPRRAHEPTTLTTTASGGCSATTPVGTGLADSPSPAVTFFSVTFWGEGNGGTACMLGESHHTANKPIPVARTATIANTQVADRLGRQRVPRQCSGNRSNRDESG
ncbi:hypothetical protein ACETU7_08985 [Rhodococcus sp. 3Y1]